MKLTPNFSQTELCASQICERQGWDNTPDDYVLSNLKRLANFLEQVRSFFGNKPIIISSGYRNLKLNDYLKSRRTSAHVYGCAVDFTVLGIPVQDSFEAIAESDLKFQQVILEFGRWIHLAIPPTDDDEARQQCLIIDRSGTKTYRKIRVG
jgi:zinc D-Ala-D-Ala carboxypeptidase